MEGKESKKEGGGMSKGESEGGVYCESLCLKAIFCTERFKTQTEEMD